MRKDSLRSNRFRSGKLHTHVKNIINPKYQVRFSRFISTFNPDIIHTNNIGNIGVAIWSTARSKKIRIVHTLRDYNLLSLSGSKDRVTRNLIDAAFSIPKIYIAEAVDSIVGISRHILLEHLRSGFFNNSAIQEVIPNGISPTSVPSCTETPRPFRVGFIGTLSKRKGVESLLESAKTIGPNRNIEFRIAGTASPERVSRLRGDNSQNHIFFDGFVNPDQFYNKIDLLVVPSIWPEPFGRIVIEATSYGVPVLARAVGGLTELIRNDVNGWLFSPSERPTEIGKRIVQIAESGITEKMKLDCLNFSRKFDSLIIAKRYLDVYSRTLQLR